MSRLFCKTSLLALSSALTVTPLEATSDHRDHILGTSFDMTIHGVDQTKTQALFDETIAEIKRLETHFSPKNDDSELAAINKALATQTLSPDMTSLLNLCEAWREKTDNALSCKIGSLEAAWQTAAQTGELPDREYMKDRAQVALNSKLEIEKNSNSFKRGEALSVNPTGIAKGYIIDKALEKVRSLAPEATGIKIDIGGDAVYWGKPQEKNHWKVAVSDPHSPQDNGAFLAALALKSKAIASSGHTSRILHVADKSYSQIINPRTGWLMEDAPAATVVANDAVTADALATALSVMPIKEGLKLVNSLEGVEALIVAADKRQFPSNGWYALEENTGIGAETAWKNDFTFNIDFTIPETTEGNYKRPYVGIWVTTAKKQLTKSLMLLGESRRWMEENYVFWRRYGRKFDSIVDGITRPTRMPGNYQIFWDGRDDFGSTVEDGDYILHVEVSREHGDHTYKRFPISIGSGSFQIAEAGEGEIGAFSVKYGNRHDRTAE